jgi:hypothetical protein
MSNTITIEFCKEDRDRLDLLNSVLLGLGDVLLKYRTPSSMSLTNDGVIVNYDAHEAQGAPEQPDPVNEHPVDEVSPHGQPEPVAEPELPKYTKDNVLAKVQTLATPGHPKREEAKAIIKSYGTKVSDIPEDKYNEVMDKLTALEG